MNETAKQLQFDSHRNSREYWLRRRFYDRRTLFVNCWHANQFESAAMWSAYTQTSEGIAIVSNYERIHKAFSNTSHRLFCGMVEYLDFEQTKVNNSSMFPMSKRMSFSYENELRLAYWDLDIQSNINQLCTKLSAETLYGIGRPKKMEEINWSLIEKDVDLVEFSEGIYVPLDLDMLIEEVRISPTAPVWFQELTESLTTTYGLNKKIVRSDITSAPLR